VFGVEAAERTFAELDDAVAFERLSPEGAWQEPGTGVLRIEGPARALLTGERTALNLLQRLSGIATLTARYVQAVEGTDVQILDTRKTTPGLRMLEKAAVRAGGGTNHRVGLFDAILIKENHVAAAGGVEQAVQQARAAYPDLPLEVECRNVEEIAQALQAGAPRILLDNMDPEELRAAVDQVVGRAELEASGGITLETVRAHAVEGLNFISVGALTHSAPALDLSLILEPLP
jgi:nicotinate-nucleotide pyrophosphorylase (carboxylating)